MDDNYHTEKRLQLLANGYAILRNKYKVPAFGWADPDYAKRELSSTNKDGSAANRVQRWPKRFPDHKTTGVRIENGLGVIDADIDDAEMIARFWGMLEAIVPNVARNAPTRFGGGEHKLALFVRIEGERFGRIASRRYNGHQVEIFGGAKTSSGKCGRQFGIYGPHSEGRDYAWATEVPDLAAMSLGDLPPTSKKQAFAIIDAFEKAAIAAGWEAERAPDTSGGTLVYDIGEATRFDTDRAGSDLTYDELSEAVDALGNLRCSSSFIAGREGVKRERCWVFHYEKHDCVAVFVYGDEQIHLPKQLAPIDPDALAEKLAEVKAPEPEILAPERPAETAETEEQLLVARLTYLLAAYAYCVVTDRVVELHETGATCEILVKAFKMRWRAWYMETVGPRQGVKRAYAADAWELNASRTDVRGVRMRPDQPFPLYRDGEHLYKNTYRRPRHAEGGDVAPFVAFLERFLPDARDRAWLLDWMAHKWARPDIPGTAVIFVADNDYEVREGRFGTGRGLMFRIAHTLFGEQYARAQAFNVLDGSSSQSVYTDWLHGSILVTVDESRTSSTAYRKGERSAAYEVLKDIVDPAPKRMNFKAKYGQAFDGVSYCSLWVATNHADAIAIPAGDRRFTVLRNGRPITKDEAIEIDAWMREGANIGALARMLEARSLAAFNMFEPLDTAAKAEMADMALSEVEEILREMMADDTRGLVFTREHLMLRVGHNFNAQNARWQGDFAGAWNRYCTKAVSTGGETQRRIRTQGTLKKLFCFRVRAREVERLPEAAARREAAKWGPIDGVSRLPGLTEVIGDTPKTEDDQ